MKYINKLLPGILFISIFLSGLFFISEETYSINKSGESRGETRNLVNLIFSTNRIELKNKIDFIIFNSEIRNSTLKKVADLTWEFQNKSKLIDFQFFNTEIFYGKNGAVFPKYTSCQIYELDSINISVPTNTKFIFLVLPMKQEIETEQIHNFQRKYSVCNNESNMKKFLENYRNDSLEILDTYKIFDNSNSRFYESGDTHWSDFGVKTIFLNLIEITHKQNNLLLEKIGLKKENNIVLKRLGLIDKYSYQNEYVINFQSSKNKEILIIHDSFFEDSYVSKIFIEQYYNAEFLNWGAFQNMSQDSKLKLYQGFEYVLFESSVDSFFEERLQMLTILTDN